MFSTEKGHNHYNTSLILMRGIALCVRSATRFNCLLPYCWNEATSLMIPQNSKAEWRYNLWEMRLTLFCWITVAWQLNQFGATGSTWAFFFFRDSSEMFFWISSNVKILNQFKNASIILAHSSVKQKVNDYKKKHLLWFRNIWFVDVV